MGFKRVRFNNFKNLEPREIKWSPGLNLLIGENGAGKTNILEGINIISGRGAFDAGARAQSAAAWGSGSFEVRLTGETDADEIIRVKISNRYTISVDERAVTAAVLRVKAPVLAFLPDDMAVIEGSAACRRKLLDMLLSLIIPSYSARLTEYRRGVRQKAAFLKREIPTFVVDRALLPLASWIWDMRKQGVELLEQSLSGAGDFTPEELKLTLKRGGVDFESEESDGDDYAKAVVLNRDREAASRLPLVGPHRDDISITTGEHRAKEALSRGLRRRAAIALMLSAADGVKRKLGKTPVLLLDEVTAELDAAGRRLLAEALAKRNAQVFAATAEPFDNEFPGAVYKISSGTVERVK